MSPAAPPARPSLVATLLLVAGLLAAAPASAVVQLVVEGGALVGARDVVVQGQRYDVDFVDGTCADLYDGCDEDADFTFQWTDPAATLAAREALMDQVFVGIYDTQPELTRGCTAQAWCWIFFPIQKTAPVDGVGVVYASNDEDEPQDLATGAGGGNRLLDLSNVPASTYAVWSGPLGPATPPAVPISPLVGWGVFVGAGWIAARATRADAGA